MPFKDVLVHAQLLISRSLWQARNEVGPQLLQAEAYEAFLILPCHSAEACAGTLCLCAEHLGNQEEACSGEGLDHVVLSLSASWLTARMSTFSFWTKRQALNGSCEAFSIAKVSFECRTRYL